MVRFYFKPNSLAPHPAFAAFLPSRGTHWAAVEGEPRGPGRRLSRGQIERVWAETRRAARDVITPCAPTGPTHSSLIEAPSPVKPSLEPVGTSRGQAQKCTPEEDRRKPTFKYCKASTTNLNRLLPPPPSQIRPHPALGC